MDTPAYQPLNGDRNVLFEQSIAFFGFDFTGCSSRMMIRNTADAAGSAIISLTFTTSPTAQGVSLIYGGTDTVANHIAAGRIARTDLPAEYAGLADTDLLALSLVGIRILKSAMALGSNTPQETGDTVELAYDLLITPLSGDEDKYAYGPFNVRPTVTYP